MFYRAMGNPQNEDFLITFVGQHNGSKQYTLLIFATAEQPLVRVNLHFKAN